MYKYSLLLLLFLPVVASAQTGSLQQLLVGIGGFLNNVVIPFILAIAFIVFIVNAVRYFIIGGASDDGQKNAKNLAVYGIGAFVFILSFWGLVNILVDGVGLTGDPCYPVSDYINPSDGTSCPPPGGSVAVAPVAPPLPSPTPEPPPTLPSPTGDPSPVRPGPPTLPPVSFDPNGNPLGNTLAVLQLAQRDINATAAAYIENSLPEDFGSNATIIESLLRAPLDPAAFYRLNQIGVISDTEFNTYLTALNAHNAAVGTPGPPVTRASLAAIPVTIPRSIVANQEITTQMLQGQINGYNQRANGDIDAVAEIEYIFNPTISSDDRHNRATELIRMFSTINPSTAEQLYERIVTDINTQSFYYTDGPNRLITRDIE